jgi:iron(III) transport system permease protein
MPFVQLFKEGSGLDAWSEAPRILSLAGNSLALASGTLLCVLPVGVIGAILLYRTDLPYRESLRFLVLLTLFVPLPVFAAAWQAALGIGGWLPLVFWNYPVVADPDLGPTGQLWKPWGNGLGSAVWVHAMAGLPWVVVLVGLGLCWVEKELEEEALLSVGPGRVLLQVTLPRARVSIFAAALWVALQACTEITITDVMQVRTFAEEVYTQFAIGDRAALARAVAVSLPLLVLASFLVFATVTRWQQSLPPLHTLQAPPRPFLLKHARWPVFVLVLALVLVVIGIPLGSLIRRAGLGGDPQAWSLTVAWRHLDIVLRSRGGMILESLGLALFSGLISAGLALLVSWQANDSAWFGTSVLVPMAVVWAMSAPILGLGLKQTIAALIDIVPMHFLAVALYYGPSPLPALWVNVLRFFPAAIAILWPLVRLLPPELRDAARVDGATPWQELCHIVWPLTRRGFLGAAFAVTVLSLGELSAGKLIETPGSRTFAQAVFDQMHFGVGNDLAALCLVLLGMVTGGSFLVAAVGFGWQRLVRLQGRREGSGGRAG